MIEGELLLYDKTGQKIGFTTIWLYDTPPSEDGYHLAGMDVICKVRVKPFYKTTKRE